MRLRGLALLLGLLVAAPAGADVILLTDGRFVRNDYGGLGCGGPPSDIATPIIPFFPFVDSVTSDPGVGGLLTASQDSSVSPSAMAGTGSVSNGTESSHWCALSTYVVTFEVTEDVGYHFSVTSTLLGEETFGFVRLEGNAVEFQQLLFGTDTDFDQSGVLLASATPYELRVSLDSGEASGSFDFVFALPEPGAELLLGLAGLLAAFGARSGSTDRVRG